MAKKAKIRLHPMPPLGWQDQLLYWSAMDGAENLRKVIRDWGLSPGDMAALNRLFGVTS